MCVVYSTTRILETEKRKDEGGLLTPMNKAAQWSVFTTANHHQKTNTVPTKDFALSATKPLPFSSFVRLDLVNRNDRV